MIRKNLFDGDCDFAAFAQIAYKLLMTREWVTYKSIMDICYPKDKQFTVSSGTGYGELKKAFPAAHAFSDCIACSSNTHDLLNWVTPDYEAGYTHCCQNPRTGDSMN